MAFAPQPIREYMDRKQKAKSRKQKLTRQNVESGFESAQRKHTFLLFAFCFLFSHVCPASLRTVIMNVRFMLLCRPYTSSAKPTAAIIEPTTMLVRPAKT